MPNLLTVMTYNICDGGSDRLDLIRRVIASYTPQIVLLNEADDEATVRTLAQALDMTWIWAHGSGTKHIALLSHLPVVSWKIYNRRPITQALLEVELEIHPNLSLRIYGVHLLPYSMFLPFEIARWRTMVAALRVIQPHLRVPHLVLGDFNTVASGESLDLSIFPTRIQQLMRLQANRIAHFALRPLAAAKYTDVFRAVHPHESGRTWMPTHLAARFDYIFADPQMAACVQDCRLVTADPAGQASDHFPLVAEFDLTKLSKNEHIPQSDFDGDTYI